MALLASAIGMNKAALVDLVGSQDTVNLYAQNDDDNIDKSLNASTDAFRSAAIKGEYSAASVDALTSSTCPESVKRWILHLALDEMTSGGMGRPDSIAKYGDEARKWLSRLAGGAETIDGLSRDATTGGRTIRVGAMDGVSGNTFDKDNERSASNTRGSRFFVIDPEI